MKYLSCITSCLFAFLLLISCKEVKKTQSDQSNTLLKVAEPEWESLMDATKWRAYNQNILPTNWSITDSLISCFGKAGDMGGDIISTQKYANFEFSWEWKISSEGNSGVFYHVIEDTIYHSPYQTAPEYQLLDDVDFPSPIEDWQKTGANYA
ncbi:MAG: hypothetical protein ACI8V9_000268, partial [Flavobacteriaceae bacterium]